MRSLGYHPVLSSPVTTSLSLYFLPAFLQTREGAGTRSAVPRRARAVPPAVPAWRPHVTVTPVPAPVSVHSELLRSLIGLPSVLPCAQMVVIWLGSFGLYTALFFVP